MMWYLQSNTRNQEWHLKSGVYDNIFELFKEQSGFVTGVLILGGMFLVVVSIITFLIAQSLHIQNPSMSKPKRFLIYSTPLVVTVLLMTTIGLLSDVHRYDYYEYEKTALIDGIEDNHKDSTRTSKKINVYLEPFEDPIILDKSDYKHLKEGDNVIIRTPSELYDEDKNIIAYTGEVMSKYRNHIKVIKESSEK